MSTAASSSAESTPYALAIHTASPDLGLAVSNFAGDRRCQTWALGREVSSYLHTHLMEFIQPQTWAELAFLAVAKGPGGFTGTRIGMVTARTLAQQLDIPLFAISTLAAVAWAARSPYAADDPDSPLPEPPDMAVQLPAQRGELHVAIYSIQYPARQDPAAQPDAELSIPAGTELMALLPDSVMSQERWQQILDTWHRPYQRVYAEADLGATAQSLLDLAYLDWQQGARPTWSEAIPFYGQSPV
jgi:tRNA threonylcarbamoyl adenosine modification protein YeaZ